jgi:uncharacterized membrane protein YukC
MSDGALTYLICGIAQLVVFEKVILPYHRNKNAILKNGWNFLYYYSIGLIVVSMMLAVYVQLIPTT